MKHAMNRFCALVYGADDGLGGMGGIEELALLQLERLLELGSSLAVVNRNLGMDGSFKGEPRQDV